MPTDPTPEELARECLELYVLTDAEIADYLRGLQPLIQRCLRAEQERDRLRAACISQNHEIEQTLGKALGYPWFKDDQKNFPGTTEADGVLVGDHVAESLALEVADRLDHLRQERDEARKDSERLDWLLKNRRAFDPGAKIGYYLFSEHLLRDRAAIDAALSTQKARSEPANGEE